MENVTKEISEKPVLRLTNTVVRRVVPMTSHGCDALRAIRRHFQEEIKNNKGVEVDIPYPTVFHMAISQFCELKGIKVEPSSD